MSAPDWMTRAALRELKGRPRFRGTVQRVDRHTLDRRGLPKATHDPRGLDPLEVMRANRKPPHPILPPSHGEYRRHTYADARRRAMEHVRGLRHAEFLAGCAALAADARRLRAEVAR